MCGKLLRMIDVHAPATRACHEPLRDSKLYITEKNNYNSGFRIKFLWVARRCHVHSFGFWFTKGYLKDLWGHSLRSGEMQYKKPSFTQNHWPSYHTGAPHEGYIL